MNFPVDVGEDVADVVVTVFDVVDVVKVVEALLVVVELAVPGTHCE